MWMMTFKVRPMFRDSPATVREPDVIVDARSWRDAVDVLRLIDRKHIYKIEIQHIGESP